MKENGHLLALATTSTPRLSNSERTKAWRAANPERSKAHQRRYREANPDKDKQYYKDNSEQVKARTAEWYSNNRRRAKSGILKRKYGISIDQFDAMFAAQGSRCAICLSDDPAGKNWVVDHCHTTSLVRGVLCNRCNVMLGMSCDSPTTLAKAITYLGK